MNKKQFWNTLEHLSGYETKKNPHLLPVNIPAWTTLLYYVKLLTFIFDKSRLAKKGGFDDNIFAESAVDIINIIESIGGSVHISGLEEIRKKNGPFVYIANHMSMIDTFILPSITLAFSEIAFVLKEDLLEYPFFGTILKSINHITVSRQNPRKDFKKVITEGSYLLENKRCSIIIFPQTTRSMDFDVSSFNSLGIKLAKRAKVPVIPVALKTDFLSNGKIIKEIGTVDTNKKLYVKFGEPVVVEGNGHKTHQQVIDFISQNLQKWGALVKGLN